MLFKQIYSKYHL